MRGWNQGCASHIHRSANQKLVHIGVPTPQPTPAKLSGFDLEMLRPESTWGVISPVLRWWMKLLPAKSSTPEQRTCHRPIKCKPNREKALPRCPRFSPIRTTWPCAMMPRSVRVEAFLVSRLYLKPASLFWALLQPSFHHGSAFEGRR
jgi:hypothetical protein